MAIEVERKFLVASDGWRAGADAGVRLTQFYLAMQPDRTVRLRVRDDGRAILTLKFGTGARHREEFEYEVPLAEAREMQRFAVGTVIEKTRHVVSHGGYDYEVDLFAGALKGLVVAELETPDDIADEQLPDWLGPEVTHISAFYNASLAAHGMPDRAAWPSA
jgi:adenylate cyclase